MTVRQWSPELESQAAGLIGLVDSFVPDSDDAYPPDSAVMRLRRDERDRAMYEATWLLEQAIAEIHRMVVDKFDGPGPCVVRNRDGKYLTWADDGWTWQSAREKASLLDAGEGWELFVTLGHSVEWVLE